MSTVKHETNDKPYVEEQDVGDLTFLEVGLSISGLHVIIGLSKSTLSISH